MIASLARPLFAFAVASTLALFAEAGEASTFSAWQVAHVPWGDTLNVRAYPSARSRMQAAYPNGTRLQMTGRCTGGVDLFEIGRQPRWRQQQTVRSVWCEVWHDPTRNGDFVTGWVHGRYIAPLP